VNQRTAPFRKPHWGKNRVDTTMCLMMWWIEMINVVPAARGARTAPCRVHGPHVACAALICPAGLVFLKLRGFGSYFPAQKLLVVPPCLSLKVWIKSTCLTFKVLHNKTLTYSIPDQCPNIKPVTHQPLLTCFDTRGQLPTSLLCLELSLLPTLVARPPPSPS